jgi:hypothetical protein
MFARLLAVWSLVLILVLLAPLLACADPEYTFTILDLPALSGDPNRIMQLRAIANDGTIAGNDNALNGYSSRIAPDLTATPVTCPPEVFTRYPFASMAGPAVAAMNNHLTVVGDDEGISNLYGFEQTVDGTCTFTLVPGSVGTFFTGVNDAGDVVGTYWTSADEPPFGLRRFHGLRRESGTIIPLAGLGPNDVVWPTAINDQGTMIGYLFADVQPDNSYAYQAFVRDSGGIYRLLDAPNGGDLWLTALNNAGQAVGVAGSQGVIGGDALLYNAVTDSFTTLPEPPPSPGFAITAVLPTAINDLGQIVGLYIEDETGVLFGRTMIHGFLATPVVEAPPDVTPPKRHKRGRHKHREYVQQTLTEALAEGQQHGHERRGDWSQVHRRWRPVLDEDGSVCLTDGLRVIGRRP